MYNGQIRFSIYDGVREGGVFSMYGLSVRVVDITYKKRFFLFRYIYSIEIETVYEMEKDESLLRTNQK